jgi:hypothetical protein
MEKRKKEETHWNSGLLLNKNNLNVVKFFHSPFLTWVEATTAGFAGATAGLAAAAAGSGLAVAGGG